MKVTLEPYELEDWELTRRRLGRREFADAEFLVRHRIARHGLRPTYAALLARVLKRAGKYNEALSTLDESLAQYPNSMRLHAEKGDTHFARMEYVLAADDYARALSVDEEDCVHPDDKEFVQDNLAMSRYFLGDAAGAAELIRPLVVTHPEEARFRENYARALAQSAGEDVSLSNLPDMDVLYAPELGALLCWRLLDAKRFYDALRCSGQLIAKYPDNPQSICCHADVLYRLLRFDEAVDVLENAICRHVDAGLYATLAKCHAATGQIRSARETCLAGMLHFPDNQGFLFDLFDMDFLAGRMGECRKYAEKLLLIPDVIWGARLNVLTGIARKFSNILASQTTKEGERVAKHLGAIRKSVTTTRALEYDPGKVILPEEADLPDSPANNALWTLAFRDNAAVLMDVRTRRVVVRHGCRAVVNQPPEYARTVFLAGRCMTISGYCDSVSLGSALQDVFNSRADEKIRVVNYGGVGVGFRENTYLRLMHSKELRPGDKVFYFDAPPNYRYHRVPYDGFLDQMVAEYNMIRNDLAERGAALYLGFVPTLSRDPFRTLADDELHDALRGMNAAQSPEFVGEMLASFTNRLRDNEFIFSYFDAVLQEKMPDAAGNFWRDSFHYPLTLNWPLAEAMHAFLSLPAKMKRTENLPDFNKQSMEWLRNIAFTKFLENEGIRAWIAETYDAGISNHRNVGAIVMNCNPFTLGHRYLVEKALESVEALYLFVVEEDLSRFSFADRLMLAKEGVRDFGDRVKAVPSGKFIISSFSFFGYFTKAVEVTPPDSTTDVLIFASMIAPALNIRTRFVGEEPTCMVTRSYNERMLELLPDMGCAVRVIPRKEADGAAISASGVRKALEEDDWESIKNLVPETTYTYLAKGTQHNTDYRTFLHFRQNHVVLNAMSA